MSASAMLETVQEQAESGELDELDEIVEDFGERAEELFWREHPDGSLLAAENNDPDVVAKIQLGVTGDLDVTQLNLEEAEVIWRRLSLVSSPSTTTVRQYD